MHTEIIELTGKDVLLGEQLLREKIQEYHGVRAVHTKPEGDKLTLTVECDDTAAGEFDDSALFILERDLNLKGVEARFLSTPHWLMSVDCEQDRHTVCAGTVRTEFWQTSMRCQCTCHEGGELESEQTVTKH